MPRFCSLFYAILQSWQPKGGGHGPMAPPKYAPEFAYWKSPLRIPNNKLLHHEKLCMKDNKEFTVSVKLNTTIIVRMPGSLFKFFTSFHKKLDVLKKKKWFIIFPFRQLLSTWRGARGRCLQCIDSKYEPAGILRLLVIKCSILCYF